MVIRKAGNSDYRHIRTLYISAFPRNERAPFFVLKRRVLQNRATMLVAEENGEFVGFAYTIGYGQSVYLFYFAVAEKMRGSGNGSEILRLLKEFYAGKVMFLAREPVDESAPNNPERIRRREFYVRNGFVDLPLTIREVGVAFDVMSTSEALNVSDYNALITSWAGKLMLMFVKMEITEKHRTRATDPFSRQ